MMPDQLWVYRARLVRVVDGDTMDVTIDAGFHSYRLERLRLLGLNAPEVKGPTKAAGDAATAYVKNWLGLHWQMNGDAPAAWPLVIQTAKSDVFGRFLATVWSADTGACLNDDLVKAGHAVPFNP